MVGQLALDQHIGVRLPVSQPLFVITAIADSSNTNLSHDW